MRQKKRLGQCFLSSPEIIQDIVSASGEISGHNILEVGAGTGNLTKEILSHNPATLYSIEIDEECIPYHQGLLSKHKNYKIIRDDALKIQENKLFPPPIKVIANLPYNISIALLCKWLDQLDLFNSFTLMFQKEVAERIVASHGNKKYGKISVITQLSCKAEFLFSVPKEFFSPIPKVDSAVIQITPYKQPLFDVQINSLKKILHTLFCHRRKMIHTILKKKFYNADDILNQLNIDMKLRPEDLSIEQFCNLANHLT